MFTTQKCLACVFYCACSIEHMSSKTHHFCVASSRSIHRRAHLNSQSFVFVKTKDQNSVFHVSCLWRDNDDRTQGIAAYRSVLQCEAYASHSVSGLERIAQFLE